MFDGFLIKKSMPRLKNFSPGMASPFTMHPGNNTRFSFAYKNASRKTQFIISADAGSFAAIALKQSPGKYRLSKILPDIKGPEEVFGSVYSGVSGTHPAPSPAGQNGRNHTFPPG